jgi:hypothetical protein
MHWPSKIKKIPNGMEFGTELLASIEALTAAGKKIYVIDDVPRFPFTPERCKFTSQELGKSFCEMDLRYQIYDQLRYLNYLEQIKAHYPDIKLIQLRDLFCNTSSCSMVRNNQILFRDDNHLNILGSKYVGKYIANEIRATE